MGWLRALRDGYARTAKRQLVGCWIDQQLEKFPSLRDAVVVLDPEIWTLGDPDWHRRLSHTAERLLGALLGKGARTMHLRRGDYERLLRADLRLARCECGTEFFRRRSEPNVPNLCELCRERALAAGYDEAPRGGR